MKLYTYPPAPNPRRLHLFLAEKGLELPTVEIDLRQGEQFSDEFQAINPCGTVPALVLDDGECIGDSIAICRYLEELHPEPPLFGNSPLERARIEWWNRRVELEGMLAVAESLRNGHPAFADRAWPGPYRIPQVAALAERGADRARQFLDMLDGHLSTSEFLAGEAYSIADISAVVTVDFTRWIDIDPLEERSRLTAWHKRVTAREAFRS